MESQISGTPPSSSPPRSHRKKLSSVQMPKPVERSISADQDYGLGRMSSYDRAQIRGTMQAQQDLASQPILPADDGSLLLASLDQAPVEDEAEATLLQVLERRQNVISQMSPMDQMQTTPLPVSRGLASAKSKRQLFRAAAKAVVGLKKSTHGLSMKEEQGQSPGQAQARSQPGPSRPQIPPMPRPSLSAHAKMGSFTNRGQASYGRHRRAYTSLPNAANYASPGGFYPESTQSSASGASAFSSSFTGARSSFSTPAERARHVAITMKAANPSAALASNNLDESVALTDEGAMPDLINIMEAKRDNEEENGSHTSAGSTSRNRSARGSHADGRSADGSKSVGSRSDDSSGYPGRSRHKKKKPFAAVSSPFMRGDGPMSQVEQLFEFAEQVQDLFEIPEGEENEEEAQERVPGSFYSHASGDLVAQNSNFLANLFQSHPEPAPMPPDEIDPEQPPQDPDGRADEQTPMLQKASIPRRPPTRVQRRGYFSQDTRLGKIGRWLFVLKRQMAMLVDAFDAGFVSESLWSFVQNQFSFIIVPALAVAYYVFYYMGNPSSKFLPTDASDTWCILFAIRAYLTLQLAFVTEYLIVDVLAMRSPLSVQLIGPLATLYTIQAKGWPFILTMWGIWNFLLLYGDKPFYYHWLFFTDIGLFNSTNEGNTLLSCETYREILLSMIVAGVATSIKRTVLALYLGKRVYIHYKPKLEKMMVDMLLLAEVAELASALDDFEFERVDDPNGGDAQKTSRKSAFDAIRASTMQDIVHHKNSTDPGSDSEDADDDETESTGKPGLQKSPPQRPTQWSRLRTLSDESGNNSSANNESAGSSRAPEKAPSQSSEQVSPAGKQFAGEAAPLNLVAVEGEGAPPPGAEGVDDIPRESFIEGDAPPMDYLEPPTLGKNESVQDILRQDSSTAHIKALLDRWEEPVNKLDKASDPTIHEVLQFRKALSFLDDTHPFSLAFGPASTRDNCIKSSKRLYKRLLNFSPGSTVLHFDVLGVLAYEQDGSFDEKKAKGLVRLFRPDKFDEVTLLAFIQSCDLVYKKLRYLRASVGNSTLIDYVLEDIFNVFFNFFLLLTIMSILELNPWALFMSMSTIVVSFAFALGPSAAKLIEGMIMIALRRPFDLGDRISIVGVSTKPDSGDPGFKDTWLVEDCNLFTTTLRLSRTNEVSTVNNGSIANTRIINHGRSNNATVTITVRLRIEATYDHVQIFKSAVEQYISDNPRVWVCLDSIRLTTIDPASYLKCFSLKVQNVKTWQELMPVLQARGELEKFCTEILTKLGIEYSSPHGQHDLYVKETVPQQTLVDKILPDSSAEIPPDAQLIG